MMPPNLKLVIAQCWYRGGRSIGSRRQLRNFASTPSTNNESRKIGISMRAYVLTRGLATAVGCYMGHLTMGGQFAELEQSQTKYYETFYGEAGKKILLEMKR